MFHRDEFTENSTPYTQKLYSCDPKKNKECKKTSCYMMNLDPQYGECKYTTKPEYRKNGKVFQYNLEKHEIEEVQINGAIT